jgi:hypothetical protein
MGLRLGEVTDLDRRFCRKIVDRLMAGCHCHCDERIPA